MLRSSATTVLLLGLLAPGLAAAQAPMTFTLDPVFVSRFRVESPSLDVVAARLRGRLEARLRETWLVVPLSEVEPFEDYSASTYLASCPADRYVGCTFVIGERAHADWAVAAEIAESDGGWDIAVSYIDVRASRVVLTVDTTVHPETEDAFLEGVAGVLDRIIAGEEELEDLRGETVDDETRWAQQRENAALAAEELGDLGGMVRSGSGVELDRPRLRVDDLSEYDDRDDTAPWVRMGMTREEYVRFKNSGRNLLEWNHLRTGRQRRVLIRVGGGFGAGPFHQYFDGRWALDPEDHSIVEREVFQQTRSGATAIGELELGFGLTPTLEIGVRLNSRTSTYRYVLYQEVVGNPDFVPEPRGIPTTSFEYGGVLTWAPLPTSMVRPTLSGGVSFWRGADVRSVVVPPEHLDPPAAPGFVFLHGGPGVEAVASEHVAFFARLTGQVRATGTALQKRHDGAQVLSERYEPEAGGGTLGGQITAGVVVRIAPFGVPSGNTSRPEVWEPDF